MTRDEAKQIVDQKLELLEAAESDYGMPLFSLQETRNAQHGHFVVIFNDPRFKTIEVEYDEYTGDCDE